MADWSDTLRDLREKFLEGAPARLERIEGDLRRLETDARDAEALADLRLTLHGLSGLGGSYGFPRVSALATDGEQRCDEVTDEGRPPGKPDLTIWHGILAEIRRELGSSAPDPVHAPPGSRER